MLNAFEMCQIDSGPQFTPVQMGSTQAKDPLKPYFEATTEPAAMQASPGPCRPPVKGELLVC